MFDDDLFFTTGWLEWRHVEILTFREAALLLTGHDPAEYRRRHGVLPGETQAIVTALEHAVRLESLRPFAVWGWDDHGDREPVDIRAITPHTGISDETTARVVDLAKWADARGIAHHWRDSNACGERALDIAKYPQELCAAIEAFEAVRPLDLAGRSAKGVLLAWLDTNRPQLSANARERIATVANWQPTGGAPKTPGG